jgi:hypothetical protein
MTDAMHRNNSPILREKPQDTGVELAYVSQFKQSVPEGFG